MDDTKPLPTELGEIEGRLSDGESLLRSLNWAYLLALVVLPVGALAAVFSGETFWMIVGLILVLAALFRLFTLERQRRTVEEGLRLLRVRRAELQARLLLGAGGADQ